MEWRLLVVMGIAWAWVALRFVRALPGGWPTQLSAALLLLLVAQYQQITGRFFGSIASPELPQWLLIVIGWAFGSFLLLAMLLLLRDLIGLGVLLAWRRGGRLLLGADATLLLGLLAALLGLFGTWQGLKLPAVKTVTVTLRGLPAAFDGYRIVQLSDLHAQRLLPARWQQDVVDQANALQPDLIVITGDLQDGEPQARADDVAPLAGLRATDGALAVPGNHEYYADYQAWMTAFAELGLPMLVNQHRLIQRGDAAIAIVGLADRQATAFAAPGPDLQAATAGLPDDVPFIVLQHQPRSARDNATGGAALQLSGHTHGGQILGPSVLTRYANNGFLAGVYRVGDMTLYVSRGTGLWNGLVLRLGAPSEITELELHAG